MKKFVLPISIIVIAALMRLVPHPANITPIAAMALFGGCYLDKRLAIVLPLGAMFLSDIFLGFHNSMPYVYSGIAITSLIGMWVQKKRTIGTVVGASVISSLVFFIITNFNYWLPMSLYPKTFSGQITAYFMALPFFRNALIGDLLYTGLLFGGYELVVRNLFGKAVVKHS